MASARDIQSRIKSVQDTMKITNAMYLISSTKVKKARRALTEALPHFEQSEELIEYLLGEYEDDTQKLWQSNLFGKPLSDLVREGLSNKLMHMPEDTQLKVQQTLEKIINDRNGGMVCILL